MALLAVRLLPHVVMPRIDGLESSLLARLGMARRAAEAAPPLLHPVASVPQLRPGRVGR